MTTKLCYILPEYSEDTDTHYYHIYELLEVVASKLDLYLIIEKGHSPPNFRNPIAIYVLKQNLTPLRWAELLLILARVRLRGCRSFYVHYSPAVLLASLVARLSGGTTYFWHCGHAGDFFTPAWRFNLRTVRQKLFHDYRFVATLKSTDYLVTGSEDMADYYHREFGIPRQRIRVMPNWVDLDRFNPKEYDRRRARSEMGIPDTARVVLFVHRLARRKGAQYLARIAQQVCREVPNTLFLIVGDGPYKAELRQDIGRCGLDGVVKLVGSVPNKEIMRYYSVADAFIMPSDEEGFPRVLLEAMAMGVPIVATHIPSLDHILTPKQREFVVPRGDIGLFAEKVAGILHSPQLRQSLGREGLESVKDYSKDGVVKRFVDIVTGGGCAP